MTPQQARITLDEVSDKLVADIYDKDARIAELEAELAKAKAPALIAEVRRLRAEVADLRKNAITSCIGLVDDFDYSGEWKNRSGYTYKLGCACTEWLVYFGGEWQPTWGVTLDIGKQYCRDGTWTRVAPVDKYAGEWVWCGPEEEELCGCIAGETYRITEHAVQWWCESRQKWRDTHIVLFTPALMREQIDKGWWKRVEKDGVK